MKTFKTIEAMGRLLLSGIAVGIFIDRYSLHKVIQQKNQEIENVRENFMVLGQWLSLYENGKTMGHVLQKRGLSHIAIYGMGILGHHLYQQLKDSGVQVKYVIDQKPLKGIYEAEICKIEAELKGIDAIIVTPVYQFEDIKNQIRQFHAIPVVSLLELLER